MIDIVVGILVLISAIIIFIASIGILRFKSLYSRMHVVTKVSSFAFVLLLIALNILFFHWKIALLTLIIFHILIFLSPISAHMIAKVSQFIESKIDKGDVD
ncbi:MAG TPA: monovalent cation/H(+) antiporter subunit G [Bacteroidales bacterium]|nr:monovalent cation/H(+) antiporter subunit G [Bacteroidales bacterium]